MNKSTLSLALLVLAAAVLGTIAVRAKEPNYAVPAVGGALPLPLALEGEVPEGASMRTFHVDGVCCEGCGAKLHEALASVEGVRRIAFDPLKQEVQVLVPTELQPERLAAALTFDKYVASERRSAER